MSEKGRNKPNYSLDKPAPRPDSSQPQMQQEGGIMRQLKEEGHVYTPAADASKKHVPAGHPKGGTADLGADPKLPPARKRGNVAEW